MPARRVRGVTGEHWFGLEPGLGRRLFIRMVYGLRTSLFIALGAGADHLGARISSRIASACSRLGGRGLSWITDFALRCPFLIFASSPSCHGGASVLRSARPSFDDIPDALC